MHLLPFNTLDDIGIKGIRVLVRVDWNVPIDPQEGALAGYKILDDSRIRANFPTFDELLRRKARRIYVMTHLGRPKGRDEKLRTFSLKNHFAKIYPNYSQEKFTVLDNIRFDPREEKNSAILAKRYAGFCKIYVNDAFSASHNSHMSVDALPRLMAKKYGKTATAAGRLFEKEYRQLANLKDNPKRPLVAVIGGAKIEDKKPAILRLAEIADKVLVGGLTALAAEKDSAIASHSKVILPTDYLENEKGEKWDIGPRTIKVFGEELKKAQTVFLNGNLGKSEEKGYEKGSVQIIRLIAGAQAETIAAGGDTEKLISDLKLNAKFSYVSLAGGAALAFLSGEKLPGLEALENPVN